MSKKLDKEETPKSRSRNSFRLLTGKTKEKRIQVKAHLSSDDLEKKKSEVERTIQFHKDAVQKNIPEFLADTATILLENIIALTNDLPEIISPSRGSNAVAPLTADVYQSVAQLLWWSNQFHLHGNDSKCTHSLDDIAESLKSAVSALVSFVANNEAVDGKQMTVQYNKNSKGNSTENKSNSFHGSLPEIPTLTLNDTSSHEMDYKDITSTSKLMHSLSSDSILDKDNTQIHTKLPDGCYYSNDESFDDTVPPIPPKKLKSKGRISNQEMCSIGHNSHLSEIITSLRRSTGSNYSGSHSVERMSPATSHDSMNFSLEERNSFHSISANVFSSQTNQRSPNFSSEQKSFDYHDNSTIFDCDRSPRNVNESIRNTSPSYCSSKSFTQMFETSTYSNQSKTGSHFKSAETQSQVIGGKQLSLSQSSRLSKCSSSSSSRSSDIENDLNKLTMVVPPELPKKLRYGQCCISPDRVTSQYENVCDSVVETANLSECDPEKQGMCFDMANKKLPTGPSLLVCSRSSSSTCSESGLGSSVATLESVNCGNQSECVISVEGTVIHRRFHESLRHDAMYDDRPPLPLKKKHIMEYLEIVRDYQRLSDYRRSQQSFVSYEAQSIMNAEPNLSSRLSLPPALPPKTRLRNREFQLGNQVHHEFTQNIATQEKPTCPCMLKNANKQFTPIVTNTLLEKIPSEVDSEERNVVSPDPSTLIEDAASIDDEVKSSVDLDNSSSDYNEENILLDLFDVSEYLTINNKNDSPYISSGLPDGLLVQAAYSKNGSFLDAFLTTYRTFMSPETLLDKLTYRYKKFLDVSNDPESVRACKSSFALLVKATHEFKDVDLKESLVGKLAKLEYDLLSKGELKYALMLRKELACKLNLKRTSKQAKELVYPTGQPTVQHAFLDLKAPDVAEQICLLEAESFNRVGYSEVLHWSRDQNEEKCPNLRSFTMHFNNISFWVKMLILKCNSHDREKYFKKFVKIIKHLRKLNNFNSCLAILSAIESSAIERLGLHHSAVEELKEYHHLFDHFSFKLYRKELGEAKPPCIPYLGIILKDLTLAHYGNSDYIDGMINFEKRWIQYKILKDMKKFNPCKYKFKRNEAILKFFNSFEHSLTEDDVWDISYKIKPKNE